MSAYEKVTVLEFDNGWSSAFANGFADGQAARDNRQPLRAYVRVGIDDYAQGFRQGFFTRTSAGVRGSRPTPRSVAVRSPALIRGVGDPTPFPNVVRTAGSPASGQDLF
jgi:hypothetical protein